MNDTSIRRPDRERLADQIKADPAYVWDLPTRLFHWGLVAGVAIAWWTGGSSDRTHEIAGYVVVGLIAFRLFWGFAGTKYARFSSFVYSPLTILRYLGRTFTMSSTRHLGHNPTGSVMIFAFIIVLITLSVTGVMMQSDAFFGVQWVENVHEQASNALLIMIPLHLLGVLISSMSHRENLLGAMITGSKREADDSAGDAASLRDVYILRRIHGSEGLVVLVLAVIIGGAYGWQSTSGRTVLQEEAPPEEIGQTKLEAGLSQQIQDDARKGASQDYVAGGPAIASRAWLVASGGRLYDNWYRALGKDPPATTHPSWPAWNKSETGGATWRCKNCHGWDYQGKRPGGSKGGAAVAGAIPGIRKARRREVEDIVALLSDSTHRYTNDMLPAHAKYRIALFVTTGLHTISRYIRSDGSARAAADEGRPFFQNMCAACHGFDGRARKLGKSADEAYIGPPLYVGTKANNNAVEVFHKIRNGHPGAAMISMRPFPITYSTKLLAYVQTLPRE